MGYDQTQLRKIYRDKMRSVRPHWDLRVAESKLKYDFHDAVSMCVYESSDKAAILRLVDKLEAGELAELGTELRINNK